MASGWASGLSVGETVQWAHSPEMSTSSHSSYSSFPPSARALLKSLLSSSFQVPLQPSLLFYYRSRVLFSSKFFSHFSRSFSFVSIKIIILRKKIALYCFFPLPSLLWKKNKTLSQLLTRGKKKTQQPSQSLSSFAQKTKDPSELERKGGKKKKKDSS